MNRKIFKKITILLLVVFATFFSLKTKINAVTTYKAGGLLPFRKSYYEAKEGGPYYYYLCYYYWNGANCNEKSNSKTDGDVPRNAFQRKLRNIGIYYIYTDNVYEQAYCIEPGSDIPFSAANPDGRFYDATPIANPKTGVHNFDQVQQLLTFAPKLDTSVLGNLMEQFKDVNDWKNHKTGLFEPVYDEIFAAQEIIWELVTGQRDSFKADAPERANYMYSSNINQHDSFYNVVINSTQNNDLTTLRGAYKNLRKAAHNAFEVYPGDSDSNYRFSSDTKTSSNTYKMNWDDNKKQFYLKVEDENENYKYWEIDKVGSSLSATITSNKIIEIISKSSISKENAEKVGIKVKNNHTASSNAIAFKQLKDEKNYQNVIKVVGTTKNSAIYVYTPKYQLKVVKVDADDSDTKIEGAKFYVCNNSLCGSSNAIETITTNENGEAICNKLERPGTYYIKEAEAPTGYLSDDKTYSVLVTKENETYTSSYATQEIKNKQSEFTLNKKVWDEDSGSEITLPETSEYDEEGNYIGPKFVVSYGKKYLVFDSTEDGVYTYKDEVDSLDEATKLKTFNGSFKITKMPSCKYYLTEQEAPKGQTLPKNPSINIDVCSEGNEANFVNGFTGLEFTKRSETGQVLSGGEFTLQVKENNYYKDILLKESKPGLYYYEKGLTEEDESATYIFKTGDGTDISIGKAFFKNLPSGEYRIIEKSAPDGYELIEDKDSTSIVSISDASKDTNYTVEMVNRKINTSGGEASAELVVTITTGRLIINYALVIGGLVALLVIIYLVRKKIKK